MEKDFFIRDLEQQLRLLPYVEDISIIPTSTSETSRRNVTLQYEYRINIFFNSRLLNFGFTVLEGNNRIWALDRDNKDDWHIHPLGTVKEHQKIEAQTVKQIIAIFDKMYRRLLFQRLGITLSGWLF